METKAQVSPEFMAVYAVLFTVALIMFIIYFDSSLNLFQSQDSALAARNSQALAAGINYVYLAGEGANYQLRLNLKQGYENMTIGEFSVSSYMPHAMASAPLLKGGTNFSRLVPGLVAINNSGGRIYVGN
jgi:hypothetical protein